MSHSIMSRNVNFAFAEAWWKLKTSGLHETSRNGPVLVMPGPLMTTYMRPQERVLFNPRRDANPVFHLIETIWMLAGRDKVSDLLPFNSTYAQYAESDGRVHGAYGRRWRATFGLDQITEAIKILQADPTSRQVVVQMWSCNEIGCDDLTGKWKDRPCNTHIYFDGRGGRLNMTVCCRSNDMLWGAYGANVVHFSMLQELIAWGADLAIGDYRQFSNNFHVYTDLPMVKEFLSNPPLMAIEDDPYSMGRVQPTPMLRGSETVEDFLFDCEQFFINMPQQPRTSFFRETVYPLAHAYIDRKHNSPRRNKLLTHDGDWNTAYQQWREKRDGKDSPL